MAFVAELVTKRNTLFIGRKRLREFALALQHPAQTIEHHGLSAIVAQLDKETVTLLEGVHGFIEFALALQHPAQTIEVHCLDSISTCIGFQIVKEPSDRS